MHGCSSARTKSMAVSMVSISAVALGREGLGLVEEKFIVLRVKSCEWLLSAGHVHTIGNGPPTVGEVGCRLGDIVVLLMSLVG